MQRERDPWAISIPPVIIEERVHTQEHIMLWQVRGRTELVIDGAKVQLIDGRAVWIPAGAPHSLTVAANSVLLPLEFPISAIATMLDEVTVFSVDRALGTPLLAFLQSQASIICAEVNLARQILALIEQHPTVCGDDRTVKLFAELLHVSGRTIERTFLAETGLTLWQWRLKNRMESAAELFKTSDNIERYAAAY